MRDHPELGPLLGRLIASPADLGGAAAHLEPIRVALLTNLFERAATARGAEQALQPSAWLEVFEAATHAATGAVLDEAARRMREAAALSRYPRRRIAALLPTADDRTILAAQFSAAGTDLEFAAESSGGDLRRIAGELECAWDRLAGVARLELDSWEQRAARVRGWHRPWRPLVIGGVAAGLVAMWVGLILGGYLPVPAPLRPIAEWYWSLSWP